MFRPRQLLLDIADIPLRQDAREDISPLGVRAEKKGPVQNVWPAKKLAKVEEVSLAVLVSILRSQR